MFVDPRIAHLFAPFSYVVVTQNVTDSFTFDIKLRGNFRSESWGQFFDHFKHASGVSLKIKPHGTAAVMGVKLVKRVDKVCRMADHESGKERKNRTTKLGQPYDGHCRGCKASVSLIEKAPLDPNKSKKSHDERLKNDPLLMSYPTEIVIKWMHEGHNIGCFDQLRLYITFVVLVFLTFLLIGITLLTRQQFKKWKTFYQTWAVLLVQSVRLSTSWKLITLKPTG